MCHHALDRQRNSISDVEEVLVGKDSGDQILGKEHCGFDMHFSNN